MAFCKNIISDKKMHFWIYTSKFLNSTNKLWLYLFKYIHFTYRQIFEEYIHIYKHIVIRYIYRYRNMCLLNIRLIYIYGGKIRMPDGQ